jgi:TetR/AcrR family transcriptional regulator, regulator of cefoperazone and chloramphenicol sensitivity
MFSLLNMRSAIDSRERLIEVATAVFAREGFAAASLRMIAVEAGVSAALLVHHFGSKQTLVEECISANLGEWLSAKDELIDLAQDGLSAALQRWPEVASDGAQKLQFFKQVMLAGGSAANHLFERMVAEAKIRLENLSAAGQLRELADIDTAAVLLATYGLAPLILDGPLKQHFGGGLTDPEISKKLAASSVELFALFQPGKPEAKPKKKKKAGKK